MAHPDYEEFLAAFNDHRVRYLIGGAHALGFHARPRATKDLDVFIAPTAVNARRAAAAIASFLGVAADAIASPLKGIGPEDALALR